MELTITGSNAKALVEAMGATLEQLKAQGRMDLSLTVYIVASCDPAALRKVYRFTLCEVSHSGGRHLANLVHHEDRELLMACHADSDGTFAQREAGESAAQNEHDRQSQFRQRFLSA